MLKNPVIAGIPRRQLECRNAGGMVDGMGENKNASVPAEKTGRPKDWRDQIKTDPAARVEAGATLYGIRSDGAYIARTKAGDRVVPRSNRDST